MPRPKSLLTEEEQRLHRNKRVAAWKREARRKRGLQKQGRKKVTDLVLLEERVSNRKEWEKGWRKEYFENSPQKRMCWAAAKRAKEKGLPFSITPEDIYVPTHCPYLGIALTMNARRGTDRATVCSLDRIVPSLGYVKGNIEVISHLANTMKQNASKEQLLIFAKHVIEKFS